MEEEKHQQLLEIATMKEVSSIEIFSHFYTAKLILGTIPEVQS